MPSAGDSIIWIEMDTLSDYINLHVTGALAVAWRCLMRRMSSLRCIDNSLWLQQHHPTFSIALLHGWNILEIWSVSLKIAGNATSKYGGHDILLVITLKITELNRTELKMTTWHPVSRLYVRRVRFTRYRRIFWQSHNFSISTPVHLMQSAVVNLFNL